MSKTILVVDDEPEIRRVTGKFLERSGYRVLSAATGMEGLVLIQDNSVDLVITDIRMPGISGLDLISQIHDLNPRTPVIVITGYGDPSTAVESIDKGAFFFINKPFEISAVLDAVEKCMRLPNMGRGAAPAAVNATHAIDFDLPPDMETVQGALRQVAAAVESMDYPIRHQSVIVPFVFDELLATAIGGMRESDPDGRVKANAVIDAEEIRLSVRSAPGVYDPTRVSRPVDELDLSSPEEMALMVTRHHCDRLVFSDDGGEAVALIRKRSRAILAES